MLFDFHQKENTKKAGSVHATYLIAGSRPETSPTNGAVKKDGDDVVMAGSQPFPSSPPVRTQTTTNDDTPVLSITLAREEDLDEVRKQYESITSIHIYSLGPSVIKDLQAITDANREIVEKFSDVSLSSIGGITNKHVRKRKIGGEQARIAAATVAAAKPAIKKEEPAKIKEPVAAAPRSRDSFFGKRSEPAKTTAKPTPEDSDASTKPAPAKTAPLKRGNSGSLMASFAKAKPKTKKEDTDSYSSAAATPASANVDSPIADVSDDEEDTCVPPPPKPKAEGESARASEKEREEKLRKMMEESSDEEKEPSAAATPKSAPDHTPDDEDMEMGDANAVEEPKKKEKETKEYVVVENGRRRGKRRVMKRKTTRDAEGYIGMFISPFRFNAQILTNCSHERRASMGVVL